MEETTFEDLLKRFNLENRSALFSDDPEKIAEFFGFGGKLAKDFSFAFQPFNKQTAVDLFDEVNKRRDTRLNFLNRGTDLAGQNLQSQFDAGFRNVGRNLESAYGQVRTATGQSGFSGFGAGQRIARESRDLAGESIQDLMGRRDRGFANIDLRQDQGAFNVERQFGTEVAAISKLLQDYVTRAEAQARRIKQLDPFASGAFVSSGGGSGAASGMQLGTTNVYDSSVSV